MKPFRYFLLAVVAFVLILLLNYFVRNPAAIAHFLNSMLMMAMPLALGVFLVRRLKVEWGLFGAGAVTFIASQVLHIPFNSYVLNPFVANQGLSSDPGTLDLLIVSLLFGLSAGLFEETARWVAYRRYLKKARSWAEGLMFGAGHGGMEAMLLGALTFYVFLQAVVLRGGNLDILAPGQVETTQAFLDTYWSAPWYAALLGALERVTAICFHLSAALLVLQAIVRRNPLWYLAAVLWHTVTNAIALYGVQTWGIYITEGLLLIVGGISIWLVFLLRKRFPEREPPLPMPAAPLPPLPTLQVSATAEKLDDSRYDR